MKVAIISLLRVIVIVPLPINGRWQKQNYFTNVSRSMELILPSFHKCFQKEIEGKRNGEGKPNANASYAYVIIL